jgi:hypothetical protein
LTARSHTTHGARGKRALFWLVVLGAVFALAGGDARANGGAKYDFRVVPSVGRPTTTFRVSFTAPFRTYRGNSDYTLEGVGPSRCPSLFDFVGRVVRRGERVVIRLTPFEDLFFNTRSTWCLGSYVGYVYNDDRNRVIGYFRFGVERAPVSLEP